MAIILEMQAKHHCWSPRPIDFAAEVQPVIQTPDHSTFPSGHATEAFAIATMLHRLTGGAVLTEFAELDPLPLPFRIAHRIAVNRTVAGVHFPCDSAAGAMLGCAIGQAIFALGAADGDGNPTEDLTSFTYAGQDIDKDFTQGWLKSHCKSAGLNKRHSCTLLGKAISGARAEWVVS